MNKLVFFILLGFVLIPLKDGWYVPIFDNKVEAAPSHQLPTQWQTQSQFQALVNANRNNNNNSSNSGALSGSRSDSNSNSDSNSSANNGGIFSSNEYIQPAWPQPPDHSKEIAPHGTLNWDAYWFQLVN